MSIMIDVPTTGLVIDAMRNMVEVDIRYFDCRSMTPCADRWTILPLRATTVTAPAMSPAAILRWIICVIRCSRSDERPTSSGLVVGDEAAMTITDASDTASAASTLFIAASCSDDY